MAIKTLEFLTVLIDTLKTRKFRLRVKYRQNLPHKIDVKLRKMEIMSVNEIEKIIEKFEIRVLITTHLNGIIS
jgi:hypothetical protein